MSRLGRRSVVLLAIFCLAFARSNSARVGQAQQPAPVRVSLLRNDLAEAFELDRQQVHLNLPPTQADLLGAVFTIDPVGGGLQIIERLDAAWFAVDAAAETDWELSEDVMLNPTGEAFTRLLEPAEKPASDIATRVALSELRHRPVRLRDRERVAAAILNSPAVRRAARAGKPLLLATSVISGKANFEMPANAVVGPITIRLPNFTLVSRADEAMLRIESERTAHIAYTANRLVLRTPDGDSRPDSVLYQVALVDGNLASAWDRETIRLQAVYGVPAGTSVAGPQTARRIHGSGAAGARLHGHSPSAGTIRIPQGPRPYSAPAYRPPGPPSPHTTREYSIVEPFSPLVAESFIPSTDFPAADSEDGLAAPEPPMSEPAPPSDVAVPRDAAASEENPAQSVTVLYGTSRAMVVEPPSWTEHLFGFIRTTNGWITVAALAVVAIVLLLALGFAHLLSPNSAATVIGLGGALYAVAAVVHGVQQDADYRKIEGIYGNQRGELQYGLCEVSVPQKRERGTPPTPFSVYLIRMPEDPEKHFIVTDLRHDKPAFLRELKQRVAASDKKDAFVFIHGFNVTFGDAVKRTAQLCVDMEFQGAPLCFTWPSQGELKDYLADSNTARVASFRLREFLLEVEQESGAERIHLIAHSMGNDVLTQAMERMQPRLREPDCKFREVLLAAPDIDKDVFQDLAEVIRNGVQHITLYASENDRALNESYRLSRAPRAGMAGQFLTLVNGIDTIDVSNLDTDFLGHATYGDHELAVRDLGLLLREGKRPDERGLIARVKGDRTYWLIRK